MKNCKSPKNEIVGPWFKTYDTFKAGAKVFLPVVEWKNRRGEPCRGFEKFTEVRSYGGIKIAGIGRPVFIVKITNRSDFSPENIGEKWKVLVEKIEAEKKPSVNTNGDNQKAIVLYYVYVEVLGRVENTYCFCDQKAKKYVVEVKSGVVSLSKDVFHVLEEESEFLDGNMVVTVSSFFADINGNKKLLFLRQTGGVSISTLKREEENLRKKERGIGKKNKKDKEIAREVAEEIEKKIATLPKWTGLEDAVQMIIC